MVASVLFGIMPWYVNQLAPLSGTKIFYARVVVTLFCVLPTLFIPKVRQAFFGIFRNRRVLCLMTISTAIASTMWWLFVWSPVNGYTKELSLGFFILPLALSLTGRLVFSESIKPIQYCAIAIAVLGIFVELVAVGRLPWVTLAVTGAFPVYFTLRRWAGVHPVPGLIFECLLMCGPAFWMLSHSEPFANYLGGGSMHWFWLLGLGALSFTSTLLYLAASSHLPVSLFGLLSYLEPTLLFLVAIVALKEPLTSQQLVTYSLIGLATLLVCVDTAKTIARSSHGSLAQAG